MSHELYTMSLNCVAFVRDPGLDPISRGFETIS
jgi:hypothetical protein